MLESRDPRWWLPIGITVGVGLAAKWNIAFLAAALLAGFAATATARPLLRSRWLVAGAVIAAALCAPDVIWQALHGWPNLAVFHHLQGEAGHNRAVYWIAQVVYTGIAVTPLWIAGLVWSLRSAARQVPAGGDRLRGGAGAPVRSRRQAVLPGRDLRVPVRRRGGALPGWLAARAPLGGRSAAWPRG